MPEAHGLYHLLARHLPRSSWRSTIVALTPIDTISTSGSRIGTRAGLRARRRPVGETLYEETRFPACSPALLEIRGRPRYSLELRYWPLLHHLARPGDWTRWFASQGDPPPDLSSASGFRLYSMLVQAAVEGMGVAIGHPAVIARELSQGTLVPLFDRHNEVRTRRLVLH